MPAAAQSQSAHSLVELAEVLALAVSNTPPHISALCRALGVSERTLRKEFHKTYGITPCRRLRLLRLTRARSALQAADCRFVTVTGIATSFGFVELGRFSVEYRKMFGESPSQTLQRAPPDRTAAGSGSLRGEFYAEGGDLSAAVMAESRFRRISQSEDERRDIQSTPT
jgi:transcriptional regulator GlxA family with amidase domain